MTNRNIALTRTFALLVFPAMVWGGMAYEARHPIKTAAHEVVMAAKDIKAAIESAT